LFVVTVLVLVLFFFFWRKTFSLSYALDAESQKIIESFPFVFEDASQQINRWQFLRSLAQWYPVYMQSKWQNVDYSATNALDDSLFTDVTLEESRSWLAYFAWRGIFTKQERFWFASPLTLSDFITVMKRLWIVSSLDECRRYHICDKELTQISPFVIWTYLRFISRLLNSDLRVHRNKPIQYIQNNYEPFLPPSFRFPLKRQSLNWCYFYSLRNILVYKFGIDINIATAEKFINKKAHRFSDRKHQADFNGITNIYVEEKFHIESLITLLQVWEPVAVSYLLDYKDKYWKTQTVAHVASAYSFDYEWVRVAETVSNSYVRVPWSKLFDENWMSKQKYMRTVFYNPKQYRSESEISREKDNNFLLYER